MPGLQVYRSNRLEALLAPLGEQIARPDVSAALFQPDTIVVQGRGMVPYVQRELSARHGIAAGLRFPYPNRLLRDLFALVCPRPFPFDVHWLTWRILNLLPGLLDGPEFQTIAAYIKKENDSRRLYRLSRSIADVFDQYIIHNPDMVADWSRDCPTPLPVDQAWQGTLWRALFPGERLLADGLRGAADPARELNPIVLKERLIQTASAAQIRTVIPRRLFLFGLAALPALHQEIFLFLAERVDLCVFALDAAPRRVQADASDTADRAFADRFAAGAVSRGIQVLTTELFEPPARNTLLGGLQADLFAGQAGPLARDESVSVHACHSPLREVEVLYNHLLDVFTRRSELTPADVLIVSPSAETYAPLVQAVFAGGEGIGVTLPVRLTSRSPGHEAGFEALLRVLRLLRGRMRAEEVFEVLELPVVRERFDLKENDIALLRELAEKAGVRWGLDETHRAALDLPAVREHTWSFGLDRLLLGYALPEPDEVFETETGLVLPVDALEGESARVFACFLEFFDFARSTARTLAIPRGAAEWQSLLRDIAAKALSVPARDSLEETLGRLRELAEDPGFEGLFDTTAILTVLEDLHREDNTLRGGPGGEITFGSLLPARQIPYAVVCMLGMNQNDFPSRPIFPSFDLLEENREYRRQEEIRLFQEHLLSARANLFISYVGRDITNNREKQPSAFVTELLERMEAAGLPETARLRRHRLQPFHPAYFQEADTGLYSYIQSHFSAARALLGPRRLPGGLFAEGTDGTAQRPPVTELTLEDLEQFLAGPADFFVRRSLKLNPGEIARLIPGDEPFQLDRLDAYALGRGLVDHLLEENPDPALFESGAAGQLYQRTYRKFRAAGLLPHGAPGEFTFRLYFQDACFFFADLQARVDTRRIVRQRFAPAGSGCFSLWLTPGRAPVRLTGRLPADENGLIFYRPAPLKGRDLLACWARHLILNLIAGDDDSPDTLFAARRGAAGESPVAAAQTEQPVCARVVVYRLAALNAHDPQKRRARAREYLNQLLVLLDEGQQRPLPFFPETSFAFAGARQNGADDFTALKAARSRWFIARPGLEGGEFTRPAVNLCFTAREPVVPGTREHDRFRRLATEVYGPIFPYLREEG